MSRKMSIEEYHRTMGQKTAKTDAQKTQEGRQALDAALEAQYRGLFVRNQPIRADDMRVWVDYVFPKQHVAILLDHWGVTQETLQRQVPEWKMLFFTVAEMRIQKTLKEALTEIAQALGMPEGLR